MERSSVLDLFPTETTVTPPHKVEARIVYPSFQPPLCRPEALSHSLLWWIRFPFQTNSRMKEVKSAFDHDGDKPEVAAPTNSHMLTWADDLRVTVL